MKVAGWGRPSWKLLGPALEAPTPPQNCLKGPATPQGLQNAKAWPGGPLKGCGGPCGGPWRSLEGCEERLKGSGIWRPLSRSLKIKCLEALEAPEALEAWRPLEGPGQSWMFLEVPGP